MTKPILVLDTSTVFNLGHRGMLEALEVRLKEANDLLITPQVRAEIKQEESESYFLRRIQPLVEERVPHGSSISLAQLEHLSDTLHATEVSVILLASETAATASLDELPARRQAQALSIKVTGTMGLLKSALQQGWMSDEECLQAVIRMRQQNFRIPAPGANDDFRDYLSRFT